MGGAVVEPGRVRMVRDLLELGSHRLRRLAVEDPPVRAHDRRGIERLAAAPLELDRVDAHRGEVVQVREHVEVARVEQVADGRIGWLVDGCA